ncbi:MAG: CPBP family intramembrane metalloprotease [Eubacteriales bacterium]|nr:CPBP family intramembrane metalloprotease [Eubacteriales bacterium]
MERTSGKFFYFFAPVLLFAIAQDVLQSALRAAAGSGILTESVRIWAQAEPESAAALYTGVAMTVSVLFVWHAARRQIAAREGRPETQYAAVHGAEDRETRIRLQALWTQSGGDASKRRTARFVIMLLTALCLALAVNLGISLLSEAVQGALGMTEQTLAGETARNLGAAVSGELAARSLARGTLQGGGTLFLILGILVYGVISPVAEEAVFRGLLFERLREAMTLRGAALCSALVFGVYHGNAAQACYGAVMGVMFAYCYAESGRIAVPVLLHGAVNLAVFLLSYTGGYGALVQPAWAVTFLCLAGIGAVCLRRGTR